MGYRIEYDAHPKLAAQRGFQWKTAGKWGIYAFSAFLLGTCALWPEGRELLGEILFSGDVELTQKALRELAAQLDGNCDLSEAVTAFCREIINGASAAN